jgi:hypothetical protein
MTMPRYAQRKDGNERAIIQTLEAIGALVYQVGKPADLLVRWRGVVHILEVDNPASKYRKRDDKQLEFLRLWQVPMVRTPDEALRAIGAVHHG